MATEIRHVMFTVEEAITALREYCISAGKRFPHQVAVFSVEGVYDPLVRVSPPADLAGSEKSVSFAGKELVAPLLLYCRRKKIPLPARGEKEIVILNKQLTLVIKLR